MYAKVVNRAGYTGTFTDIRHIAGRTDSKQLSSIAQ